jgi:4-amino-4-deoxy-L-arabinose transferase-like glycosyltransferase
LKAERSKQIVTEKEYEKLFWAVALGLFFFHLVYIRLTSFDLAADEAYYWDWARHLALGYYSKPPLVAWVIALFTGLGGNHPFFVRLGAVLFSLGGSVVLFYLGRSLFNSKVGFWACILANATPGLAVGSVIMTIDSPLMFFWGLTIFLLHLALSKKEKGYWYAAGVSLGLGLLSKYTIVALIPSLFLYIAFSPTKRFWLKEKEPYLFIFIGLLILSPTLYWNYIHQWSSITQPAGLVGHRNLSGLTTFIWFFAPQAGILSPITFLLVFYGLWQGGKQGMLHHDDRLLFLFWHAIALLGFYLILSLFSVCYVNWAAPAYFTAFILAVAVVWGAGWRDKAKKRILIWALLVGMIISLSAFTMDAVRNVAVAAVDLWADIAGANISGAQVMPVKKLPTSRLVGWRKLGAEVTKLLDDAGREHTFIVSYNRDYVSELAFYVEGHPSVYLLNLSGRIESQYDLWKGFKDKIGFDALYITDLGWPPPDIFASAFKRVEEIKTIKIYAGNELRKGYSVFYCQGFRGLSPEAQ